MSSKRLIVPVSRFVQNTSRCSGHPPRAVVLQLRTAATSGPSEPVANSNKPSKATVPEPPANPVLEKYLQTKDVKQAMPELVRGSMSKNSIFDIVEETPAPDEAEPSAEPSAEKERPARRLRRQEPIRSGVFERNVELMNNVLDPDPKNRQRWERKMVIRQIRKRGRLSKTQRLKRTEREYVAKVDDSIKTSVKKLVKLARQIAGKPIDEAILQMRYSKKRAALAVKDHLVRAKERAVTFRGMGLGRAEGTAGEPVDIELKDGSRKRVVDRTTIYIDQAWVNRGRFKKSLEHRARGRINILRHPSSSITVLLKEEATRIRQSDERQKKLENRKLWLPLADRPVTAQRQYPLW